MLTFLVRLVMLPFTLWRHRKRTVEWLAALYRDQHLLPPDEALRRAQQDFEADWQDAEIRAERFAAMSQAMHGRRVKPSDIGFP